MAAVELHVGSASENGGTCCACHATPPGAASSSRSSSHIWLSTAGTGTPGQRSGLSARPPRTALVRRARPDPTRPPLVRHTSRSLRRQVRSGGVQHPPARSRPGEGQQSSGRTNSVPRMRTRLRRSYSSRSRIAQLQIRVSRDRGVQPDEVCRDLHDVGRPAHPPARAAVPAHQPPLLRPHQSRHWLGHWLTGIDRRDDAEPVLDHAGGVEA